MAKNIEQLRDKEDEKQLRSLVQTIQKRGYNVRRENLPRGHSYRVRSGSCFFSGEKLIFIDKRLPVSHQLSLLVGQVIERKLRLSDEELSGLKSNTRTVLAMTADERSRLGDNNLQG